MLPGEPELSDSLKVSKMTIRQAMSKLVREGYVQRHRGRGTFVCQPKVDIQLPLFASFTRDMHSRGFIPRTETLSIQKVNASPRQAKMLQLDPGAPLVRLVRLRLADEVPMVLETTWLNGALLPGLAEYADIPSLYRLLEEEYSIVPTRARQVAEAASATPDEARHLGIAPGMPVLLFESVLLNQHDIPVEITKAVYRGDRYKLYFERIRTK